MKLDEELKILSATVQSLAVMIAEMNVRLEALEETVAHYAHIRKRREKEYGKDVH